MPAELGVERVRVIAVYLQTAAFGGTFGSECADQGMATGPDGFRDLTNIRGTVVRVSQKVKSARSCQRS